VPVCESQEKIRVRLSAVRVRPVLSALRPDRPNAAFSTVSGLVLYLTFHVAVAGREASYPGGGLRQYHLGCDGLLLPIAF
jgi:hypothetical protein